MRNLLAGLVINAHRWLLLACSVLTERALRRKRQITRVLLGAICAVSLLILLGKGYEAYREQADAAEQVRLELATFREEAKEAVAYADSLAKVDKARQRRVLRLQGDVAWLRGQIPDQQTTDSLRAHADSIYATLSDSVLVAYRIIPLQQGILVRQDSTIRLQQGTIAKQDTVITEQHGSILGLTQARDSLRQVLRRPPQAPKPERFLGVLPMPSRTTSLLIGALGGAILVTSVR